MHQIDKTLVNLYSNFIINNIPEDFDSIIECCDCENFVVVKGNTSHDQVLNLVDINKKFEEKYPQFKLKNTIDLISYDQKLKGPKKYNFTFYNTSTLRKRKKENDSFFVTSEFPFGSSWSQGKLIYYYFKFITYNIPPTYPFSWINFDIEVSENGEIDFSIEDNYLNNSNNVLKSAILDCFDFNLNEFEKTAKKMDLESLILNPNNKEDFSSLIVKDFVII